MKQKDAFNRFRISKLFCLVSVFFLSIQLTNAETPATVVDIIVGSPAHTTLAAAVTAAELVETLQGEGPFTVFAPTNDAFDALPDGLLDDLLADPSGALTNILLYHVAGGKVFSGDLSDGMIVTTAQGQRAKISINEDGVFINDAQVILADLEADNGVVHVIDAVITPGPATVVDIIIESAAHTTLAAAVTAAELVETLQGEGPFTVFAPTDAAFDALPDGLLTTLLEDPTGQLADILLYHVVAAKAFSTDLSDGQEIETLLTDAKVTVTINENGVFINGAEVIIANLEAENGVVHVIDAVLVPADEEELPATVVDIILGSPVHTTLAAAVTAAELVETLQGEGPFTVFAPTDAAFDALPDGLLTTLLEDPTGQLADILLYHVVAAKAFSTDLSDGQEIETLLADAKVTVTINENGVFINGAEVIIANLEAENGVVHVIDAVLVPESDTSIGDVNGKVINASVFPNPARSEITIQFNLNITGATSVEIFNVTGQKVSERNIGNLPAGFNSITESVTDLLPGIYFVVIKTGQQQSVSKIQVVR